MKILRNILKIFNFVEKLQNLVKKPRSTKNDHFIKLGRQSLPNYVMKLLSDEI